MSKITISEFIFIALRVRNMLMLFTLFFGTYANFYFHFIIHSCWWHLCRMPWYAKYVHYIHALKAAPTIYLAIIQQIYLETVWILNLKLILRGSSLLERVNTNEMRKKGRFFWEKAGAPLRWAKVDIFFWYLILWVHFIQYLKEGLLFCDFFALGAFSKRVALFCKPWAFWFGIYVTFQWSSS